MINSNIFSQIVMDKYMRNEIKINSQRLILLEKNKNITK